MNQDEWYKNQRKVKFILDLKKAGEGTALQSFRYYRDLYKKSVQSEILLEHQVAKIFQMGVELGEKIGRGDINMKGGDSL